MRRPLLEEDTDEPSEGGSTGMASQLDGLDLTDPDDQQQAGAEWDQNEGLPQGEGEWDPNGEAAAYPQEQFDDGQRFQDQQQFDDGQGEQQWEDEQQYAPPPPRRPARPQRPIDPELSETERRFAKYGFYKLLVANPFFANDGDPVAAEVETELQTFVQGRMKALLGGEGGVEAPVGFTQEEAAALKAVALSLIAQQHGRPAPQPRRQAAPKPRPPAPPPPPAAPTRRPPVSQQQARPPARPQVAPRPRPAAPPPRPPQLRRPPQLARRQPEPPPPRPQRPRPQPQQQPRQPTRQQPQQQRQGPPPPQRLARGAVPADESIVEENGRTYKIRYREASPGEYGSKFESTMRRLPVGMHTRLKNGVQILRGGPEEWIKIVRQDLTPQARDRTAMPFPRNMKMATAELADSSLQNIRLAPGFARVISRGLE